jgi:hypothetical protein
MMQAAEDDENEQVYRACMHNQQKKGPVKGNHIAEGRKRRTANTPIPSKCAVKSNREKKTELHLPSTLRNMSSAHRRQGIYDPRSRQDIPREREKKHVKTENSRDFAAAGNAGQEKRSSRNIFRK